MPKDFSKTTLTRRGALGLAAGGLVTALARPAIAQARKKAVIGSIFTSTAFIPAFVAQKAGYFADEGLDVDIQPFANSAESLPQLGRGNIVLYGGVPSAGFMNALANESGVKVVANGGLQPSTGPSPTGLYVKTDAVKSGAIKGVADLKGKRIGSNGGILGSGGSYWIGRFLEEANLTLKDVELVPLPGSPSVVISLENGQIDAGFIVWEFAQPSVEKGILQGIGDNDKAMLGKVIYYYFGGNDILVKDRAMGVGLMKGMIRASRQHLQGDYRKDPLVKEVMTKVATIPPDPFDKAPIFRYDPNLEPDANGLLAMQKIFRPFPNILQYQKDYTADQLVDASLIQEAVKQLKT